ncbi:MAG: hypothetical protein LUH51_05365 [Firmicutes bacterium]|nr:hypothetical protein [Bacillota bacterium]
MGGRGGYGGGGKNHPANYSSVRRAMGNAAIVTDALQYYTGEKLKHSGFYIKMLEDAIGKEAFNQGYEITNSEVNTMVDELLKVKSSAAKETSEEEKKTRRR